MYKYEIITTVSEAYKPLIAAHIYAYSRYWSDHPPVNFISFGSYSNIPKGFNYYNMGHDKGPHSWSNSLLKFLETYNKEFILFNMDDHILCMPPKREIIHKSFEYFKKPSMVKIFMRPSLVETSSFYDNTFNVVKKNALYRSSVQSWISRTEYLIKNLKQNMSIHDFERQDGIGRQHENDGIILTPRQNIMGWLNIYTKGKPTAIWEVPKDRFIKNINIDDELIKIIKKNIS